MRPIKFRVWHKEEKRMLYWKNLIEFSKTLVTINNANLENLNNFILMQYTGLKDKNSKEIYEGDVVEIQGELIRQQDGSARPIDEISLVKWESKRLTGENLFAGFRGLDFGTSNIEIKVIGNIYENKELLKVAPKK